MLRLRSLAFNVLFYANMIVWMLAALPTLGLPRAALRGMTRAWAHSSLFLLRSVAGIRMTVRGLENVPAGGCLIAAKHQAMWETFAFFTVFDDPCFVLKRELMRIPVFGWYCRKLRMVPVDRSAGSRALKGMYAATRVELARGREIVVFPEGTRRLPGAPPDYKAGIAFLYGAMGVPCVPVALNSGLFWLRRSPLRPPGTIIVDILPPLPPDLPKSDLMAALEDRIETASAALLPAGTPVRA